LRDNKETTEYKWQTMESLINNIQYHIRAHVFFPKFGREKYNHSMILLRNNLRCLFADQAGVDFYTLCLDLDIGWDFLDIPHTNHACNNPANK
jgi:hypothetical protein